jgi:hypothetical protein
LLRKRSDSTKKVSETDIIDVLEVLTTVGTNCAPLLADLFLYSYEADFIQGLLKKTEK